MPKDALLLAKGVARCTRGRTCATGRASPAAPPATASLRAPPDTGTSVALATPNGSPTATAPNALKLLEPPCDVPPRIKTYVMLCYVMLL